MRGPHGNARPLVFRLRGKEIKLPVVHTLCCPQSHPSTLSRAPLLLLTIPSLATPGPAAAASGGHGGERGIHGNVRPIVFRLRGKETSYRLFTHSAAHNPISPHFHALRFSRSQSHHSPFPHTRARGYCWWREWWDVRSLWRPLATGPRSPSCSCCSSLTADSRCGGGNVARSARPLRQYFCVFVCEKKKWRGGGCVCMPCPIVFVLEIHENPRTPSILVLNEYGLGAVFPQALLWPNCVKGVAPWMSEETRAKFYGIWGSSPYVCVVPLPPLSLIHI